MWFVDLNGAIADLPTLRDILDPDEQARADRFYFDVHRHRFIASHGMLRMILGRYLDTSPQQVAFTYGPYGKPTLAEPFCQSRLQFNLSHSEHVALVAIAQDNAVGVDVEQVRPLNKAEKLVENCCTPLEQSVLGTVPHLEYTFFKYWTCKEAYLKAIGSGLTQPMNQVEVDLTPPDAKFLTLFGSTETAKRWSLWTLNPTETYLAALAIEGQGWSVRFWNYESNDPKRTC